MAITTDYSAVDIDLVIVHSSMYNKIKGGQSIPWGALCNASASGYHCNATNSSADLAFSGMCLTSNASTNTDTIHHGNNTSGASGALYIELATDFYCNMPCSGASQAWVGKKATIEDNNTVSITGSNAMYCGEIVKCIDSTHVRVHFRFQNIR